jgi:sugar phosphate isomerase/epimerase
MTQVSRRTFCKAAVAALPGTAARAAARPQVPAPTLGIQAGILREPLARDLEGALARVGAIGYTAIELQWYGGNFGRTPRQLRRACDAAALRIPSALVRAGAILVRWESHLAAASEMGLECLAVVNLSEDEAQSLDDWRAWADVFNRAGETARRHGLWLALHNEPHFMTPAGGRVPYDEFIARTDPSSVALSMDAANMIRGGADPLAYLRKHQARYRLGHLKDLTPQGTVGGRFGEGRLPLKEVLAALPPAARARQFIEHPLSAADPFGDLETIRRTVGP